LSHGSPEILVRQTISRPPVYRISLIQFGLCALIALLFLLRSPDAAWSALVGGLICAIPNAYFIYKAFLHTGARQAHAVLISMYQGGMWKMILTGVGFATAFQLVQPLDVFALFTAFIVVQSTNFFVSKIANV
jgi:ATP synthase protein I